MCPQKASKGRVNLSQYLLNQNTTFLCNSCHCKRFCLSGVRITDQP
jgi:hypothetical protein